LVHAGQWSFRTLAEELNPAWYKEKTDIPPRTQDSFSLKSKPIACTAVWRVGLPSWQFEHSEQNIYSFVTVTEVRQTEGLTNQRDK